MPTLSPAEMPAKAAGWADDRFAAAGPLRRTLNKVFPDHWSFLLGEIALYSFIILLLTGTYLTFFFDPSMQEVTYNGSYTPLRGIEMSRAYESSLEISFDVRGGLIMRQIHHWAALLFIGAMLVHMFRTFFTGAFRRPREMNWMIGLILLTLGIVEGFAGYGLPDDALSGTGLRITSAIILSLPLVGTWISFAIFNGEFPGEIIISRLYIVHVLLIPAILVALVSAHMALLVKQKHTQFPGPGRTERNVVGVRMFPAFSAKAGGFFMMVFATVALLGGLFQINPIWIFGPYKAAVVSAGSQPDFYMGWLDGSTRLWPAWEIRAFGLTLSPVFWPTMVLPGIMGTLAALYPFIEARWRRDYGHHNLLQRPRDVPARTALGSMAITFFMVLLLSGGNDVLAQKFDVSLNATTWAGRIGLLLLPPIAYWITYRVCLGLQQHDREILAHGVETGIVRRLPSGKFIEVHQPLGPADAHGHTDLEYVEWAVPKKMNKLGALGTSIKGFFVPIERGSPVTGPVSPAVGPSKEAVGSSDGHAAKELTGSEKK